MAQYYDYVIKFVNKDKNLVESLLQSKIGRVNANKSYEIFIDLEEIAPNFFKEDIEHNREWLAYIEDNYLYYTHKWSPDDRLIHAISQYFPNDVLDVNCYYTGGGDCPSWYEKNGELVTKDGQKIFSSIFQISSSLIKDNGKDFKISLPIGEAEDKWGTVFLPKECVKKNNMGYRTNIFFPTEFADVSFKSGTVKMNAKDISRKYMKSISDYREDMMKSVEISGLSDANFIKKEYKKMGNNYPPYYIVKIPCPPEFSSNGCISITLPQCDVNKEAGTVCLGRKSLCRNAIIENENGEKAKVLIQNSEIKKKFDETLLAIKQQSILKNKEPETEEEYEKEQ